MNLHQLVNDIVREAPKIGCGHMSIKSTGAALRVIGLGLERWLTEQTAAPRESLRLPARIKTLPRSEYTTRGGHKARLGWTQWEGQSFAYLGVVDHFGRDEGSAWNADGTSLYDPLFDLIDFPHWDTAPKAYFWLGARADG